MPNIKFHLNHKRTILPLLDTEHLAAHIEHLCDLAAKSDSEKHNNLFINNMSFRDNIDNMTGSSKQDKDFNF